MLNMELPDWRERGTSEEVLDAVKEDIHRVGVTEEDSRAGVRWRKIGLH